MEELQVEREHLSLQLQHSDDLVGSSPSASSARAVSLAAPELAFLLLAPVGIGYELVEELGGARKGRSLAATPDTRPCFYLDSSVS